MYFFGSPLSRRFKISQLLFRTPRVSSNFEEKCIHCLRLRTKKLRVNIEVQSVRSCFCLQPDIASFSDETSSTQLLPPPTIALMKKATKPSLEHSTELSFKWPLKLGLALKKSYLRRFEFSSFISRPSFGGPRFLTQWGYSAVFAIEDSTQYAKVVFFWSFA